MTHKLFSQNAINKSATVASTSNSEPPVPDFTNENWIGTKEAARILGYKTERTLANLRSQRDSEGKKPCIPRHFSYNGRILYWKPDLLEFIAQRLVSQSPA